MNSDLNAGREEKLAAEAQFARFASVCRPFAPIYRQMTVAAVAAYSAGADISQPRRSPIATSPPRGAITSRTSNQGRPFVLIGHSQGSLMLQQLIAREIEGKPGGRGADEARDHPRLQRARAAGQAGRRHASRRRRCAAAPGETGCVITWISFREKNVPPARRDVRLLPTSPE